MHRYEKEVIYDVAEIHGDGTIRHPDSLEALKHRQDYLEKEANRNSPGRYLRYGSLLVVEQRRLSPPCYQISPMFEGMRRLVTDLDLPTGLRTSVFSKFIAAGDYVWAMGRNYDRYQNYTVEVFGVRLRLFALDESYERLKLPDPQRYKTPPQYWYESSLELIQIWRTRVFRSSSFTPSTSNPLTPYRPTFPCIERCWHPQLKEMTIDFRGTPESSAVRSSRSQFEIDGHNILLRSPTTSGRGRLYESLEEFYCEVREVYCSLAKKDFEPLRKEVMLRMTCSKNTFNKYWSKYYLATGLRWKDSQRLFKSRLIPPQISHARLDR
jgi:hypothetical protein